MHFVLLVLLALSLELRCKANSEGEGDTLLYNGNTTFLESLKEDAALDTESKENVQTGPDEKGKSPFTLDWDDIRSKLHVSVRLVTRCSRRFYPGACSEPVHSVWTYSVSQQTCIERLGCKQVHKRSNRFGTFEECTHSCRSLTDVYTHILAYTDTESRLNESDWDFTEDEEGAKDARRQSIETLENLISNVEEYSDGEETLFDLKTSEGDPPEELQREVPADIDSAPAEYMDVQYDFNTNRYRSPKDK